LEARWRSLRPLAYHLDGHPQASFPLLNTIIDRGFTHAVAFHGFSEEGILIGGGASDSLKTQLKEAIDAAVNNQSSECKVTIRIASAEDNFNGDSPENIVNRLANGKGIQIEQALAVRERCWAEIANAVASVQENLGRKSRRSSRLGGARNPLGVGQPS
jgi:phage replication-related protein YjqB (UPF0714/DUF867 family)